jgi:hypothetical protein
MVPSKAVRALCEHTFVRDRPADTYSYAYLLGAYLGDGYIGDTGRGFQLVISLDAIYPEIVEECRAAIVLNLPATRPRANPHAVHRSVRVTAGCKKRPHLFPQMGPGRSTRARSSSIRGSARSSRSIRGRSCEG